RKQITATSRAEQRRGTRPGPRSEQRPGGLVNPRAPVSSPEAGAFFARTDPAPKAIVGWSGVSLSGARRPKKIRFGAIPRGGCCRGKEWGGKAALGRGPPPESKQRLRPGVRCAVRG